MSETGANFRFMSKKKKTSKKQSVRERLKHHFIPHVGNDYHPHIFHTKRAIGYSAFFIAIKAFAVAYAALLPIQAYTAPDVLSAQANRILALTNHLRSDQGLVELTRADLLDGSAGSRALDMVEKGYFSHTGPDGHTLAYFMKQTGNRYVDAGENLAEGFRTADEVVNAWALSPTHLANIIDVDFKEFGIGISEGAYEGHPTVFIAEHFGSPIRSQGGGLTGVVVSSNESETLPTSSAELVPKQDLVPVPPKEEFVGIVDTEEAASSSAASHDASTGIVLGTVERGNVQQGSEGTSAGLVKSSTLEKYAFAKSWFSGVLSVFSVSNWIYEAFLLFFIFALTLSLAIEFRRHHPHAVMKAAGLIGLLFVLWRF